MQVGFRDLMIWSFLMASAHGAGFMLLPVMMGTLAGHGHGMHIHESISYEPWSGAWAVAVHTLGYLLVTGTVAFVVHEWVGLSLLRKAWVNLDLVWAVALMVTGGLAVVM
jgi:hypothetical protein